MSDQPAPKLEPAGDIILAVRRLKGDELGLVAYIIRVRNQAFLAGGEE